MSADYLIYDFVHNRTRLKMLTTGLGRLLCRGQMNPVYAMGREAGKAGGSHSASAHLWKGLR